MSTIQDIFQWIENNSAKGRIEFSFNDLAVPPPDRANLCAIVLIFSEKKNHKGNIPRVRKWQQQIKSERRLDRRCFENLSLFLHLSCRGQEAWPTLFKISVSQVGSGSELYKSDAAGRQNRKSVKKVPAVLEIARKQSIGFQWNDPRLKSRDRVLDLNESFYNLNSSQCHTQRWHWSANWWKNNLDCIEGKTIIPTFVKKW